MDKRTSGLLLQAVLLCSFAFRVYAQEVPQISTPGMGKHDPNRPVIFSITFQEEASAGEYSHNLKGEARYALLPSWDGYRGFITPVITADPHTKNSFTSENAFDKAGGFLGLKPKQILQFYVKEYQGTGKAVSPNGPCSWKEKRADGVAQISGTFGKQSFRETVRDEGVLDIADAEFVRTGTGGELHFQWREPSDDSACSDTFSERASNYAWTKAEVAHVRTFVFTNEQLKNWNSLHTTLTGTNSDLAKGIGGSVRLMVAFSGAVPQKEHESKVQLAGCLELGLNQEAEVTASADPGDGTFSFAATPSSMVNLTGEGSVQTMHCVETGRGTLKVTYDPGDGRTSEASHEISCVDLDSVNGGEPIPKIAFFDEKGKRIPPKPYPVSVAPEGGGSLLVYRPADPALVTAVNQGDSVLLQPVRVGETTVQPATECGGSLGGAFSVQLVYCDDEVIEKLASEKERTSEEMQEEIHKIEKIASSEKFIHAQHHIPMTIGKLTLTLTSLTINTASHESNPVLKKFGEFLSIMVKIVEGVDAASAPAVGGKPDPLGVINSEAQLIVELKGSEFQKTLAEAMAAAKEAGELGKEMNEVDEALEEMQHAADKLRKATESFDDVRRREQLCEKGTSDSEPPPPADPTKPVTPKPPKPAQPPEPGKPASQGPTTPAPAPVEPPQEPPSDEPPLPPPSPVSQPRQLGLPYEPGDCRCKGKTLTPGAAALGELGTGYRNLGKCLQDGATTLEQFVKTFEEWTTATGKLSSAAESPDQWREVAKASAPQLHELLTRADSLATKAGEFAETTDGCNDGVNEAGAMIEAAPAQITHPEQGSE